MGILVMGQIKRTVIYYKEIDLDKINIKVSVPNIIETYIDMDANIVLTQRADLTTNQICVVTIIKCVEGVFTHPHVMGRTNVFASSNEKIVPGISFLRSFPSDQKEKNLLIALRDHENICKKIVDEDSTKQITV